MSVSELQASSYPKFMNLLNIDSMLPKGKQQIAALALHLVCWDQIIHEIVRSFATDEPSS